MTSDLPRGPRKKFGEKAMILASLISLDTIKLRIYAVFASGYKKVTSDTNNGKLFHCPALAAMKVVSGKWKTRILWLLRDRPYHFNELKRTLPGVSAKVLTEQIQQLEEDGILMRSEVLRLGVAHVTYAFSDYGRTLIPILDAIGNWGLAHARRENTGGHQQRETN